MQSPLDTNWQQGADGKSRIFVASKPTGSWLDIPPSGQRNTNCNQITISIPARIDIPAWYGSYLNPLIVIRQMELNPNELQQLSLWINVSCNEDHDLCVQSIAMVNHH